MANGTLISDTERKNLGNSSDLKWLLSGPFLYIFSVVAGVLLWWHLSSLYSPIFLPSPLLTLRTVAAMLRTGELLRDAAVSIMRILVGWALGCAIGTVLGILLGWWDLIRNMFRGAIEYLRFIPPVTLVTLLIIWFGVGEVSKIVLIAWVSLFLVIVNTMAGVMSVREGAIRAAQCLGARRGQVMLHVVIPETVPYIVVGMQLALSNAFMTIVAAEMLAANSGLGFVIWNSQIYAQTDRIFAAFVALSLLGFALDSIIHSLSRHLLYNYKVT